MGLTVYQSICINQLRVDGVSNSSVLQIGSAGIIRPLSNLFNTGGFTGPAPEAVQFQPPQAPLVPLPAIT
ncbi:spore germination protein GerPB [Paenibacillus alkalitolerans]|uniref:spore germination protein GerPB n=1 Tax=Paenibacillus alkalitolerans TaxID=2799335 RepID=UPI0018F5FB00|nr:spore germination protein GerPB [Paenibacillus alkalitolerans]